MLNVKRIRFCLLISMAFVVLLLAYQLTKPDTSASENNSFYKMTIEDEKVVLYKGESFITVYADIVPQNLPLDDRKALREGILFKTRGEADRAAEDFDG